jgi:hypothetical protein
MHSVKKAHMLLKQPRRRSVRKQKQNADDRKRLERRKRKRKLNLANQLQSLS